MKDHPINQKVAQIYVTEVGFNTITASNGEEALKALVDHNFDLVLMDCQMPVMDGYTTTKCIRREEVFSGKHIVIVAMTAQAMEGDRERCLSVGRLYFQAH